MKYKQSICQLITIGDMLEIKLMKKVKRNLVIWCPDNHAIDFNKKDKHQPFVTGSYVIGLSKQLFINCVSVVSGKKKDEV